MNIKLSDHFNYRKLLRFTFPSVIMMIFTSIYGVVDGFFVSNFVGKTPFAAVNFIMPFLMILGAFGFMFGTGGSALVAKTLGEGEQERANRIFSLIVYVSLITGAAVAALGVIFLRPVAVLLGAGGEIEILGVSLGLTGKCCCQIGFRFCSLERFHIRHIRLKFVSTALRCVSLQISPPTQNFKLKSF
jgi:Na+-driven multidrug efflux pump